MYSTYRKSSILDLGGRGNGQACDREGRQAPYLLNSHTPCVQYSKTIRY